MTSSNKIIPIDIDGVKFTIAKTPNHLFWERLITSRWEEWTFKAVKEYIKPGGTFIDIGSWEGPFTLYAASLGAIVHSVEPDTTAISYFKKHIELNPQLSGRINLHQYALLDENKNIELFERYGFGDSASSILRKTRDTGTSQTVQGKTFSSFIEENNIMRADLIKMDIEGGEFSVIPSMAEGLKKLGYPPLICAFHSVYLKESYMKQRRLLEKLSKLNGRLSILTGKITANKFARENIKKVLESLSPYRKIILARGGKDIINDLLHDGTALFI